MSMNNSVEKKDKNEKKSVMGRTLMMLRKAHKLTQEQVADILKIKRSTYAYYERDITPTLENIKKLSILFNASVHFLMYGEEERDFEFGHNLNDIFKDEAYSGMSPKELRKDEALLIAHYRLLSAHGKEKVYREAKDLHDKEA